MSGEDNKNIDLDDTDAVTEDVVTVDDYFYDNPTSKANTPEADARRESANIRGRYDGGIADWNIGGNGGGGSITAGLAKHIEKEKEASDDFESGLEAASEIHRAMSPEQWDRADSTDYPGLKNGEVLNFLRKINSNLSYYSQEAVRQGLIKPEDEDDFQTFLKNELWLKEQERIGKTDTPEYLERKRQQEIVASTHTEFRPAAVALADDNRNFGTDASNTIGSGEAASEETARAEEQAVTVEDTTSPPQNAVTSVARSVDGAGQIAPSNVTPLQTAFVEAKSATSPLDNPANTQAPSATPIRVATREYDQSVGMI